MANRKRKLTPLQARFVDEYLIDLNATRAAGRAGYKDPNKGRQLVTLSNVARAIRMKQEKLSKKTELNAEWVLKNLEEVAERCMVKIPVLDAEGNETGEWRFEHTGANKALELIGKHLGMFKEVKDLNVKFTISDILDEIDDEGRCLPSARD